MNEFKTKQNLKKLKKTYASLGMETQRMSLKINRLEKLEKILHKQAEDFCSNYMDDTMRKSKETQQIDIIKEVEEMLPTLKGTVHFNQDPRGYALKVAPEDARDLEEIKVLNEDWGGNYLITPSANID